MPYRCGYCLSDTENYPRHCKTKKHEINQENYEYTGVNPHLEFTWQDYLDGKKESREDRARARDEDGWWGDVNTTTTNTIYLYNNK